MTIAVVHEDNVAQCWTSWRHSRNTDVVNMFTSLNKTSTYFITPQATDRDSCKNIKWSPIWLFSPTAWAEVYSTCTSQPPGTSLPATSVAELIFAWVSHGALRGQQRAIESATALGTQGCIHCMEVSWAKQCSNVLLRSSVRSAQTRAWPAVQTKDKPSTSKNPNYFSAVGKIQATCTCRRSHKQRAAKSESICQRFDTQLP